MTINFTNTSEYDTLFHGCGLQCMENMQNNRSKADLILADIPYGTTQCKWDSVLPLDRMWAAIEGVAKEGTPIILFGSQPFTTVLINSKLNWHKFNYVWDKMKSGGMSYARFQPMRRTEDIVVFCKDGKKANYYPQMVKRDKPLRMFNGKTKYTMKEHQKSSTANTKTFTELKLKNPDYRFPVNLLEYRKITNGSVHPTQKPVDLLMHLIRQHSAEGDLVLDFTAGSGSTGVAAANTGRRFMGCETDIEYYNIMVKRVSEAYAAAQHNTDTAS